MLDLKFVQENPDLVRANCLNRGVDADVELIVALATRRGQLTRDGEELRKARNENSLATKRAGDPAQRERLVEEGRNLKERIAITESALDEVEQQLDREVRRVPNLTHPEAPVGRGEEANREIHKWGQPRDFGFKALDHVALGSRLDLFDFERGGKVTGHNFYFLKNEAVLLELALEQFAINLLVDHGFTPLITPDMARDDVLEGTGYIPRGESTQIYSIAQSDLSLVATAEITVGGFHKDEILEEQELPKKYVALSHCYRTEAGAHGRATRGLFRVHQFSKVEMFAFTLPEQSDAMLETLRGLEEDIFQKLEIPYRVIDTCTGDLGGPAYRKYDLEAWMPGRGANGAYGEVTSTSNCTDFQARRLKIRFRRKDHKGTQFVHTLNGTAIAISRALIALLENHQQADGTVLVPQILRPYLGFDRIPGK